MHGDDKGSGVAREIRYLQLQDQIDLFLFFFFSSFFSSLDRWQEDHWGSANCGLRVKFIGWNAYYAPLIFFLSLHCSDDFVPYWKA